MHQRMSSGTAVALVVALFAPEASATTMCSFSSVIGVAFGSYNVFSASPLDSAGSITYSCEGVGPSDTIVIELSRGNAPSFAPRQLSSLTTALAYNLYVDAGRTVVWGDGTAGTSLYGPVTPTSGASVTVTIYARIPAQQNVPVGSYADTITATINF